MKRVWKSVCRNCNHEGHLYMSRFNNYQEDFQIVGVCDDCAQKGKYCPTYIPLNGLEYMEWKFENKTR